MQIFRIGIKTPKSLDKNILINSLKSSFLPTFKILYPTNAIENIIPDVCLSNTQHPAKIPRNKSFLKLNASGSFFVFKSKYKRINSINKTSQL